MTSRFFSELIDLTREQGWVSRPKGDGGGLLFTVPRAYARPGSETVFAHDPKNDSHAQKVIRDRFKKAGLKFYDDDEEPQMVNPLPQKTNGANGHATESLDPFLALRQQINIAITALSEAEQIVSKIQSETQEATRLRESLKKMLGS